MKKFEFRNGSLTMTEKAYRDAVASLEQCQKNCHTATFSNIDDVMDRAFGLLEKKGCPKHGRFVVTLPETAEEYAKSCKFGKKCTRAVLTIQDRRVLLVEFSRGYTGVPTIATGDLDTTRDLMAHRIFGCSYDSIYNQSKREAIYNLANVCPSIDM